MIGDPFSSKREDGRGLGDTEASVAVDLSRLHSDHPFAETLGSVAKRLAREMDETKPGADRVTSPISSTARELRMTVLVLAQMGTPDDGGFEDSLGTPTLPAPVRNPEGSDPTDPRPGSGEGS